MPDITDLQVDAAKDSESRKADSVKQRNIDNALDNLLSVLNHKLSEYVSKRYEKEQEWAIAEQQYSGGLDQLDDKKLAALGEKDTATLPVVNITRPKTNIAIARLQDIQFPLGGDFNFTIEPTPVPELAELLRAEDPIPGAEEATIGQAAKSALTKARDAAAKMEMKIQDRFVESDFGKRARMAMEQLGVLGSAVMKAPVMIHKRRRAYNEDVATDGSRVQTLTYASDEVPTVQFVDVRTWFPDPSARTPDSIQDCFELHLMTERELRDLHHNPAFMTNRIRSVLTQAPTQGHLAKAHLLNIIGKQAEHLDKRYSVMEYHGPIDKDVLFELGKITEEERDDPLSMYQGEVWFVNDQIIRVSVALLEGEDRIPYFICTWENDPASIFGHGIPFLMRHAARVVNSSWLMLLDNAGLTAGPQIVLNKEMIQPAVPSEGWTIKPMKVWFMTEYGASVNDAMQFVNVPTQQDSITNIIELALQFADLESSLPQILQGEVPQGNNSTFGGLALVLSASHIIQQRISEKWDDYITVPIVERFYHYEMQYGEDASLKGDFEVRAGGATERIDKQVKAQDIERIIGMAGSNPEFLQQLDLAQTFREWVATTRVGNILRPREEVEAERQQAAANPPPDPALIEAEARMQQAQAALAKIELDREMKDKEFSLRAQIEEAKVDKESREIVARERENAIKLQIAQMQREEFLMKLAAEQQKTQEQVARDLNIAVMDQETKRLLKQADLDKFNTEIAMKRETGEGI